MKVALRADASQEIGTGHVMRQIALAQYLSSNGIEPVLIGSVSGPSWLIRYLDDQPGLTREHVAEGDFDAGIFLGKNFDAILIDSYRLTQESLVAIENMAPRVAVMVDGPWQDLLGTIAICPSLDDSPEWVGSYRSRFHEVYCGPEFFMLRNEVLSARELRLRTPTTRLPRVVVALGGSDLGGHTRAVLEALKESGVRAEIDVFVPHISDWASSPTKGNQRVRFHQSGPAFLDYLAKADLAITAAGTTVAEVSFLGVEAIFIPVADNQVENVRKIRELCVGQVFDPNQASFQDQFSELAKVTIEGQKGLKSKQAKASGPIDFGGASRVARVLLPNHTFLAQKD